MTWDEAVMKVKGLKGNSICIATARSLFAVLVTISSYWGKLIKCSSEPIFFTFDLSIF
jgi:hypothetical protein